MEVLEKLIGEILPYEKNPRKNDNAVERVATSIKEFGFNSPIIIDEQNVIINGHTRYKAAIKLGLETVPVVVAHGLTPEQIRAYRIMDNRSAEIASWDTDLLFKEIMDIIEDESVPLEITGFNVDELAVELGIQLKKEEKATKAKEKELLGDMEFAEELLESHNYVVLYFDNELDWQAAKDKLNLTQVEWNKGMNGEKFEKHGLGRVIKGAPIIARLKEGE